MAIKKLLKPTLILAIVLLVAVVGLYFFLNNSAIQLGGDPSRFQDCSKSGFLPKEEYLKLYTVKEGDTLLSIARNVLGDTSRVEEIIKLNNDSYSQLSLNNPFLEQGWKLKLPPENLGKTNGIILVVGGRISISDVGWGVNWANAGVGPFDLSQLSKSISNKECVVVIYQGSDIENPTALKVSSVVKQ